ncbi:hypothetical protein HT737_04910 [Pseudomonas sp. MD195_PC81_125]|uniref:hypothetical protein n=1 Tax=Pseudomonas sp. MD195_PC81_125 TaxID=2741560 RepID=UPI0015F79DA2|nr:hypothetical protein [Pseudomonas sp. MD195_PC81_125]MBA5979470.1 hypothetical protein [Pseudomonas sp. MD195_PC81_125]
MKLPTGFVRSANVAGLKWIASQGKLSSPHMASVGAAEGCDLFDPDSEKTKIKKNRSLRQLLQEVALAAGYPDLVGAAVLAAWVVLVVITVCCFHG